MATSVSICSNALLMLGANPFSDFKEDNDQVRLVSNLWPSVRDNVLRAHTWNCCIKRVLLSPLSNKPAFDFSNQFALPSDWLRTIQVGEVDYQITYRSEGRNLLASVDQLPLVYVYRNDQPSTYSTNLIHLLEVAMAAKIAYAVTSSSTMRDSMLNELNRELSIAKAIDGQDDPPEEFGEGSFIESRWS